MKTGLEHLTDVELSALHRMASNGTYLFQSTKSLKHGGREWYVAATGLGGLCVAELSRRILADAER